MERNEHLRHPAPSIRKVSRAEWRAFICLAPWERLKIAAADPLAWRAHVLATDGRETLHNHILGDHGRPNRY